mmetsp:Transcript_29108/g.94937  ORF Transcript_29108/g.94937 Transcript_29108/m.94937 type:complete len:224 (-) Transcript_29108:387-1058(-)
MSKRLNRRFSSLSSATWWSMRCSNSIRSAVATCSASCGCATSSRIRSSSTPPGLPRAARKVRIAPASGSPFLSDSMKEVRSVTLDSGNCAASTWSRCVQIVSVQKVLMVFVLKWLTACSTVDIGKSSRSPSSTSPTTSRIACAICASLAPLNPTRLHDSAARTLPERSILQPCSCVRRAKRSRIILASIAALENATTTLSTSAQKFSVVSDLWICLHVAGILA